MRPQAAQRLDDVGLAALVSAARQIDLAPSGNASKSFKAALTQETGRVRGVIVMLRVGRAQESALSYMTTNSQ